MAESPAWHIPFDGGPPDGVEALIRAAGSYVRPTDDLRPRVLEAARLQSGERSVKRWIGHAAVLLLVMALSTAGDQGRDLPESRRAGLLAAAGFNELVAPAAASHPRSGDVDWRTIDAFTELRRQQAELLRFAM